jgi:hypothetical protein
MTTELQLKEGDRVIGNGLNLICIDVTDATEPGSVGEQETSYVFNTLEGRRHVLEDWEITKLLATGAVNICHTR